MDIFGGSPQNDPQLGVISMHFIKVIFLRAKYRMGGYFLGLLKFQIFFWEA